MKKNSKSSLILIFLIIILTLLIINSKTLTSTIISYTKLFFLNLFPTSFILFTFSSLLINYNLIEKLTKLFKRNSASLYIILMSIISGFPSGSKYTKELYKKKYLSSKTASRLLMFTHFPNPLFILGPVSLLIKNNALTFKLLISIYLANILLFLFFPPKNNQMPLQSNETASFSTNLNNAISSALKTLILIYGTSLFFYLISYLINNSIPTNLYLYVLINGFFDLTKGIFSTSIINSSIIKSYFILLFLSLGSISIHMQIKSILSDTSLNYKFFLFGRLLGTILSLIIFTILINI